jgi:hypothetical protein
VEKNCTAKVQETLMATVGAVTEAAICSDGKSGYGFEVTTDDGPFSLTYENEQDARNARDIMDELITDASRVSASNLLPLGDGG